jgi:cell division protease FtsH
VAGEANAAFLSVAGSEFVEVFAGEGASRVRELFAEAASVAPAIVFIDEIDAIGARRSSGAMDTNREREQTLNQILVELDGFEARSAVIIMAATNRPDILDPALVRPGRFDRQVTIAPPDRAGRRAILALYAHGKRLDDDVDLDAVAGITRGFSGADLANVLNEAALLAARRGSPAVAMAMVEEGIERAYLGVASRGVLLSDEERTMVAYHEAGHALVADALTGTASPHKLSIVPRGGALGRCTAFEVHDRVVLSRPVMIDQMAALLGGWVAEKLVFGHTGSGVGTDLERVGEMARRMVRQYGMSDELGALDYPDEVRHGGAQHRSHSEAVARAIDTEVRHLVDEAGDRARTVLSGSRPHLDAVARALIAHETLSGDDLRAIAGHPPPPPPPGDPTRLPPLFSQS